MASEETEWFLEQMALGGYEDEDEMLQDWWADAAREEQEQMEQEAYEEYRAEHPEDFEDDEPDEMDETDEPGEEE